MAAAQLYCGLISGTSMDGVDAALVDFSGPRPQVVGALCLPYSDGLRQRLQDVVDDPALAPMQAIARLDIDVARHFAKAVDQLLQQENVTAAQVEAIGSHGQNLYHGPEDDPPVTVQVGDPNTLAEQTGLTVVADFRRRDVAAGGQGAPLAPALHTAMFRSSDEERVVINIGGIANLTLLPANRKQPVSGYDIGPGNCLLDEWHQLHQGGAYDRAGQWSQSGTISAALLEAMQADSYFQQAPPKSTGRELFNLNWVSRFDHNERSAEDVQATLVELTATTIAEAVSKTQAARVLVCGGGVHNEHLMQRLSDHLPNLDVEPTSEHGLDPDWVEATLFAWLARETLAGRSGNLISVTGASHAVILGGVYAGAPTP